MSHIHSTGIAKVQQLNCAKGKAWTLSVIDTADQSTDIPILLLQDPWLASDGRPPHAINYDLLVPTCDAPRCATYVCKNLKLSPHILHE